MGHWKRHGRERDGAEDLPAGARQAEVVYEPVAGGEQPAIEAEHREDQIGEGLAGAFTIVRGQ